MVSLSKNISFVFITLPSVLPGSLELMDASVDLPGLKWMPGVNSWKVHWLKYIDNNNCFSPSYISAALVADD